MLKKLLTGCLTIAFAATMSTTVMAQAAVHGFVASAFGQHSSTLKDASGDAPASTFQNNYLGVFDVSAKGDKLFAGVEIDVIPTGTGNDVALSPSNIRAGWMINDMVSLIIGEQDPRSNRGFTDGGGTSLPLLDVMWDAPVEYARGQVQGLFVNAKVSGFDVWVGLGDEPFRGSKAVPPVGTTYPGSSTFLNVSGPAGPVNFTIAMLNGTIDNPDTPDDTTASYAGTLLGVKYGISDTMAVMLDIGSLKQGNYVAATGGYNDTSTVKSSTGLGFSAKGLGPGNLDFTYGTEKVDKNDQIDDADDPTPGNAYTDTYMNLKYSFYNEAGGDVFVLYGSKATAPANSAFDSYAISFIGIGAKAGF